MSMSSARSIRSSCRYSCGLLGAYLTDPAPGVLVTTQRPMSIQRLTAAHELGHFMLQHQPSLDDESILRRMPITGEPVDDFQEIEADAFAVAFMMPRWLVGWRSNRQGWSVSDFLRSDIVYQLALRIGASYEATCWTLVRHQLIEPPLARDLLQTQPRALKAALLESHRPQDYRGDVWLLTERDAGTRIDGSRKRPVRASPRRAYRRLSVGHRSAQKKRVWYCPR
jgi:IrrE N-terminal-like domain